MQRKIGYVLAKEAFEDFRKRVDYSEYGGAPLLGVKGVCLICHGRSNTNAIKNAIRVAAELARGKVARRIEDARALGAHTVFGAVQYGDQSWANMRALGLREAFMTLRDRRPAPS